MEDGEFDGFHVASIHNHPENIYSPPSGKNFGILMRDFEDYELIAGFEYFWILKAKGIYCLEKIWFLHYIKCGGWK